jgi:signal transduction histidine kinase
MLARQAAVLEEQLANEQRLALLQRNFVSMASHEFRTPLTVIDGHA